MQLAFSVPDSEQKSQPVPFNNEGECKSFCAEHNSAMMCCLVGQVGGHGTLSLMSRTITQEVSPTLSATTFTFDF